jgi:hypothetical protein
MTAPQWESASGWACRELELPGWSGGIQGHPPLSWPKISSALSLAPSGCLRLPCCQEASTRIINLARKDLQPTPHGTASSERLDAQRRKEDPPGARGAVGQWLSSATVAEQRIKQLRNAAERETDPSQRVASRSIGSALADVASKWRRSWPRSRPVLGLS